MVSLEWIFYMMIIFFALVGSLRGWQREVLAMTGLIASIAALNQFGYRFIDALVRIAPTEQATQAGVELERAYFYGQLIFHCTVAFFSYQVVARLAEGAAGNRFGDKMREGFQRRFIGAIIGSFNGYLLIGTIWSFLEFKLTAEGYVQRLFGEGYPFDQAVIRRPDALISIPNPATCTNILDVNQLYQLSITAAHEACRIDLGAVPYLPLALANPNIWLLLFFIAFFIVIVALI